MIIRLQTFPFSRLWLFFFLVFVQDKIYSDSFALMTYLLSILALLLLLLHSCSILLQVILQFELAYFRQVALVEFILQLCLAFLLVLMLISVSEIKINIFLFLSTLLEFKNQHAYIVSIISVKLEQFYSFELLCKQLPIFISSNVMLLVILLAFIFILKKNS